jgi:ketosteroid isomerase-like protein
MSLEAQKELDDFFRSMRQACNSRDIKAYRSHFWTDKRFLHMDSAGRTDEGWGAYEEALDQDFRYMDTIRMDLKDIRYQVFEEQFALVAANYSMTLVDPGGREVTQEGRVTFTVVKMREDWKIVSQHFSLTQTDSAV